MLLLLLPKTLTLRLFVQALARLHKGLSVLALTLLPQTLTFRACPAARRTLRFQPVDRSAVRTHACGTFAARCGGFRFGTCRFALARPHPQQRARIREDHLFDELDLLRIERRPAE